MENYETMKDRHQKMYNKLPLIIAFTREKLEQEKEKNGVKDDSELVIVYSGAFIKKADCDKLTDCIKQTKKELKEAMKNEIFAIGAFACELANNE